MQTERVLSWATAAVLALALVLLWSLEITGARHLTANLIATYLVLWGMVFAASSASRRHVQARFLASTFSIGLALALVEALGFSGWVDFRKMFGLRDEDPWLSAGNRYDEELLFAREPGLALEVSHDRGNIARSWCLPASRPPARVSLQYDALGFRNAGGRTRADVVVLGDSYIEGVETPLEATLPVLLEELTGRSVANLGLSGYGPQQQLAVLTRYGLPFEPDVVVWAFYEGNDLNDIREYDDVRAEIAAGRRRIAPTALQRTFTWNALLALYEPLRPCTPPPAASRSQWGTFRTKDGEQHRMLFVDPSDPLDARGRASFESFRSLFLEAHAAARTRGIRLVLVFVPTAFRVHAGLVELAAGSDCRYWGVSDLPLDVARMAEGLSPPVEFVDLTPDLRAAAARGELVYLPDDTHWTEEGHRIAAAAIAPHVHGGRELVGRALSRVPPNARRRTSRPPAYGRSAPRRRIA